jgi:hypothetical protein
MVARRRYISLCAGLGLAVMVGTGVATTAAAAPTFTVQYAGSGSWATRYHSTPPNPGGAADTNDAHDTSTQAWRLAYEQPLRLTAGTLNAARGTERVGVSIDHVHVDGLYAFDNASLRCRIRARIGPSLSPRPAITVVRRAGKLVLTVASPLAAALAALPAECAGQGDPIDGLLNDYGTPGFSFDPAWTAQRWLTGRTTVALSRLRGAHRLRVRVSAARAVTRPAGCRVPAPSYERCTTGGRWSGVLTLTRRS